ncbi:MAG: signal peptidase I [Kiritimatiellae bacterium]|nr:signal peptidase I [Kiritimatiellia bacterium]
MQVKSFLTRRRIRRQAVHLLRSARHIWRLREDVAVPADLQRMEASMRDLSGRLKEKDWPGAERAFPVLAEAIRKLNPPRPYAVLRENIEVLVVALAVAMAFRTYFVQPFKIPTSSMFPTLSGIHYVGKEGKGVFDYFPFNIVKWIVFGEKYVEIKARVSGTVAVGQTREGPLISVGGILHPLFPNMILRVSHGETVIRGQILATGAKTAGDHIFVNKIKWNFVSPERGEIMVFKTDGIRHPQIKPNEHYVKRMVGMPDETIGIATPFFYVNGRRMAGIDVMDRIQSCADGYNGYIQSGDFMTGGVHSVKLGEGQYFACGDNQRNSLDSRYWGPVPRENLVGPSFFVYWPLSARWGPAR